MIYNINNCVDTNKLIQNVFFEMFIADFMGFHEKFRIYLEFGNCYGHIFYNDPIWKI